MNYLPPMSIGFFKRSLFLLVLATTCFSPVLSQSGYPTQDYLNESRPIHTMSSERWRDWEQTVGDIDYFSNSRKKRNRERGANGNAQNPSRQNPSSIFSSPSFKAFSIFLLILLGVILVVFLLRELFGLDGKSKIKKIVNQNKTQIDLEKLEENLHEVVLSDYIQDAIADGDFALAVRLYYLEVLKALSNHRQIKWKKDKTNRDYLYEMQRSPLYGHFQDLTIIFERIWYGNRLMDDRVFREIEPRFQYFIVEIKQPKSSL